MDHEVDVVGELEPDDLQKIPSMIGSNSEHLGRVAVWLEVDDRDGMVEGMSNGIVVDRMLLGRVVDVHIDVYRNT